MEPRLFFDAHCHAFGLSHPDFLGYVEGLRHRRLEALYSQVSSPNFILTSFFAKGGSRLRNLLAVSQLEIGELFELMEDDLLGRFGGEEDGPPLAEGDGLRLGGLGFERVVIVPLAIDFARRERFHGDAYYERSVPKRLETQVRDLLEGIRHYRRARPRGLLEIRPFLGVNPALRGRGELEGLLGTAFAGWERGRAASASAFAAMEGWRPENPLPLSFAGIKLYPPLGFDPSPAPGPEREKLEYLWSFCESRAIPLVTHCDDQGFRTLPLEASWRASSPGRWRPVLEGHPRLLVDFAHFGRQYASRLGQGTTPEWTEEIAALMREYPGVHADLSFNGCEPEYYHFLASFIGRKDAGERSILLDRLLFGSDFPLILLKVRSWADYLRTFADSGLPDEWKLRFCSANPSRFLFGG